MAINPILEEIFQAWFDYEYATDEDSKAKAKAKRNALIEKALIEKGAPPAIDHFLAAFNQGYRDWAVQERLKPPRKSRRF